MLFQKVLIVCIGNICRSPTAEVLLRARLGDLGMEFSSAGIGALVNNPIEQNAGLLLERKGYSGSDHRARQLTEDMLLDADLVLTMERHHISDITRLVPEAHGKTLLLGKWLNNQDIPDPYMRGNAAFVQAYNLIDQSVDEWVKRLRPREPRPMLEPRAS